VSADGDYEDDGDDEYQQHDTTDNGQYTVPVRVLVRVAYTRHTHAHTHTHTQPASTVRV